MRYIYIFLFSIIIAIFGVPFSTVFASGLSLTSGENATTTPNVATSITGFQIVGPAAQTTPVQLRATHGTLQVSAVSGVTISGNGTSTVHLSGTVANLNAALATLTYTRANTGSDTLEVSLVEQGEVFFEDNGHLYKFISGSINAINARTAAANQTAYGATGYLATITSQEENDFVADRLVGDGWIGGSDEETEGVWKWVTGPEAGTVFWNGLSNGSAPNGQYANWSTGEPNDWSNGNPGEDCIQFYITSSQWNDLNCTQSTLAGYVVEFGAEGDMPTVVATNISITTADVPAVTSFSPINGATGVQPGANLVIGFSKTVTANTGSLLVRKTSDDSVIATIDVSGDLVSGEGTTSITVNPIEDFPEGTELYVTIPNTAFRDASSNPFAGFENDTTWVFTTADVTPPVVSNISVSVGNTSATVTWDTNESASTQVVYSADTSYATETTETNTDTRVVEHSVVLSNLLPCTVYYYKVFSEDAFGNDTLSNGSSFITSGCSASQIPDSFTVASIALDEEVVTSLQTNNRTLSVTTPPDFTDENSVVIQIKALEALSVLEAIGMPNNSLRSSASIVFDVSALINNTTVLESFDVPVTISYQYTDADIAGLEKSSLRMYHYSDDEVWNALDDCSVDTVNNIITCTAPHFSIFAIFGTEQRRSTSTGTYVGFMQNRLRVNPLPATVQKLSPSQVVPSAVSQKNISTVNMTVRDLKMGMRGDDVRLLQELLNREGFPLRESGPGSPGNETNYFGVYTRDALASYQKSFSVSPTAGYFGPKTRARMKELSVQGIWW